MCVCELLLTAKLVYSLSLKQDGDGGLRERERWCGEEGRGRVVVVVVVVVYYGMQYKRAVANDKQDGKAAAKGGPFSLSLASPRLSVRVLGEGRREEEKEKEGCLLKMRTKCVCVWVGGWLADEMAMGGVYPLPTTTTTTTTDPPLSFSLSSCAISPHWWTVTSVPHSLTQPVTHESRCTATSRTRSSLSLSLLSSRLVSFKNWFAPIHILTALARIRRLLTTTSPAISWNCSVAPTLCCVVVSHQFVSTSFTSQSSNEHLNTRNGPCNNSHFPRPWTPY